MLIPVGLGEVSTRHATNRHHQEEHPYCHHHYGHHWNISIAVSLGFLSCYPETRALFLVESKETVQTMEEIEKTSENKQTARK
jgi:hypothetical protein